ncbi:hypothetical protein [Leptolyngbya sp. FACHB-16]|nr:hypothetical protein [Leptolyngbya sp. FACHB-16]
MVSTSQYPGASTFVDEAGNARLIYKSGLPNLQKLGCTPTSLG